MTTGNLRIVPRNFHDEATLTNSIAPATGFPVTNTQNSTRSQVWKSPDGTAQNIKGLVPANRSATFFGLFRHTAGGGDGSLPPFLGHELDDERLRLDRARGEQCHAERYL